MLFNSDSNEGKLFERLIGWVFIRHNEKPLSQLFDFNSLGIPSNSFLHSTSFKMKSCGASEEDPMDLILHPSETIGYILPNFAKINLYTGISIDEVIFCSLLFLLSLLHLVVYL